MLHSIILMGVSGSGKGTQAGFLIDYWRNRQPPEPVFYLETGERLRQFIQGNSFTHHLAKEVVESGGLLPPFLAVKNWSDLIIENFTGREHLIVDGTPRTMIEAQAFDNALKFYQRINPVVLYLRVSVAEITRRLLKRGRKDDTESGIRKRVEWFEHDVRPILHFYQNQPGYHFAEVNGEQSEERVHKDILRLLRLD